jgi:hypothetical protein
MVLIGPTTVSSHARASMLLKHARCHGSSAAASFDLDRDERPAARRGRPSAVPNHPSGHRGGTRLMDFNTLRRSMRNVEGITYDREPS